MSAEAARATAARDQLSEAVLLTKAVLRNRARAIRRDWKSRSLYGLAVGLSVCVVALISLATYTGIRVLAAADARALIESIPAWAFLIYLFTDILIAFGQALGDLYLSRDMPILIAMPLRTSSILVAKFVLGVVQNEVYVLLFLMPFAIAYLAADGAPWWAYPAAVATVLLFPAMLYAPLVVLTVVVLRIVPARVAKEGLWLLGASVPTAFWFLSFYRVAHISGDVLSLRLPQPFDWLPSTWAGNVLSLSASGYSEAAGAWMLQLALSALLACPVALAIVALGFHGGWNAVTAARTARPRRHTPRRRSAPSRAVMRKDNIVFARSPQLWFNHIAALAFVAFLLVGHSVQTPLLPLTPQLAMAQIGFVAVFGALNPGMTAISLEHAGVWVLRSAPLTARQIVYAKLGAACSQALPIAAVSGIALGVGYHFSAPVIAEIAVFAACTSCAAVAAGIAFDARHPSFDWENPNHINRGLRMVAPLLWNLGTVALCSGILFAALVAVHPAAMALPIGLILALLLEAAAVSRALDAAQRGVAALEV